MAALSSTLENPRMRTMVVPREHGAWGMMLVPLVTGAVVALRTGINGGSLTLFILAAMTLFWLRTPVESWLGVSSIKAQTDDERSIVLKVMVITGALAVASIAGLLASGHNRGLLVIGAIAGFSLALQAVVKKRGRKGRMPAQVIGAIGLTSTAAGAYYVATGRLDRTALALWLANWLFAGNQVHFVQVRIHGSRAASFAQKMVSGHSFVAGQILMAGAVLAAWHIGVFPGLTMLAFVPVMVRGVLWFVRGRQPFDVHQLGFSELAQALVFGALLCAGFLA